MKMADKTSKLNETDKLIEELYNSPFVEKVYQEDDRLIIIPRVKRLLRSEYFILEKLCRDYGQTLFIDLKEGHLKILL